MAPANGQHTWSHIDAADNSRVHNGHVYGSYFEINVSHTHYGLGFADTQNAKQRSSISGNSDGEVDDSSSSVNSLGDLSPTVSSYQEEHTHNAFDEDAELLLDSNGEVRGQNHNDVPCKDTVTTLANLYPLSVHDIAVVQHVRNALAFEQIHARAHHMSDAAPGTFQWIYGKPGGERGPLQDWLENDFDCDIFWISGKAGSGKSTLMKHIHDHGRTKVSLDKWAGGRTLHIAQHYFWHPGTRMQRSMEGMLRSLLFQLSMEEPALLLVAFPQLWDDDFNDISGSWPLETLIIAFQHLGQLSDTRFGLFIDGLDEHEGDQEDLVEVIRKLASLPNMKLCVSSRPWNAFYHAFGAAVGRLQLDDLTSEDIELFTRETLKDVNTDFVADPSAMSDLTSLIGNRAGGMFLWASLTVKSLVRGLRNGDNITDLHRRIDCLPSDLDSYYRAMLEQIDPLYKRDTATLLAAFVLLATHSKLVQTGDDFHHDWITFWLALENGLDENPEITVLRKFTALGAELYGQICENFKTELRSRTGGLLEMNISGRNGEHVVHPVHTTLDEFLQQEDVRSKLSLPSRAFTGNDNVILKLATMRFFFLCADSSLTEVRQTDALKTALQIACVDRYGLESDLVDRLILVDQLESGAIMFYDRGTLTLDTADEEYVLAAFKLFNMDALAHRIAEFNASRRSRTSATKLEEQTAARARASTGISSKARISKDERTQPGKVAPTANHRPAHEMRDTASVTSKPSRAETSREYQIQSIIDRCDQSLSKTNVRAAYQSICESLRIASQIDIGIVSAIERLVLQYEERGPLLPVDGFRPTHDNWQKRQLRKLVKMFAREGLQDFVWHAFKRYPLLLTEPELMVAFDLFQIGEGYRVDNSMLSALLDHGLDARVVYRKWIAAIEVWDSWQATQALGHEISTRIWNFAQKMFANGGGFNLFDRESYSDFAVGEHSHRALLLRCIPAERRARLERQLNECLSVEAQEEVHTERAMARDRWPRQIDEQSGEQIHAVWSDRHGREMWVIPRNTKVLLHTIPQRATEVRPYTGHSAPWTARVWDPIRKSFTPYHWT